MKIKGRVINGGEAIGKAFVLDIPFSFIGDFDLQTGTLAVENHPLFGKSLAGRIIVCPTGKGGTIAPFIAYQAKKNGHAPAAILCETVEPILCESAIVIDIPIMDSFDKNLLAAIQTGQTISISGNEVTITSGV